MFPMVKLSLHQFILVALLLAHITIVCVTLYLHRSQAHRALELHPFVNHFCRLWLWLTTGIKTKAWVAIHRKHHAKCETKEDPHSPRMEGISKVLWQGAELYKQEAKNNETLNRYGAGTPNDWLEKNIYTPHSNKGYFILLGVYILLFGYIGITIWAIQMMTIPFFAAGVINGLGHYWGYRNFDCPDDSTNICPVGLFLGGEELHNNHHTYPTSAKFSIKWWEFDMGWVYIKLLAFLGLAKLKNRMIGVSMNEHKRRIDLDTLKAIIKNRYLLITKFKREICLPLLLKFKQGRLTKDQRGTIYADLKKLLILKRHFIQILSIPCASNNKLLELLHNWCDEAENLEFLSTKKFVRYIRCLS